MCAALGCEPALLSLFKAVTLLRLGALAGININAWSLLNGQVSIWGAFTRQIGEEVIGPSQGCMSW